MWRGERTGGAGWGKASLEPGPENGADADRQRGRLGWAMETCWAEAGAGRSLTCPPVCDMRNKVA